MKINIERIKKKETGYVLDFEYEIEETAKSGFKNILSAEEIGYLGIVGEMKQDQTGLAFIGYAVRAEFCAVCARCNREVPWLIDFGGEKYIADKTDGKEDNDDYYTLEHANIIDLHDFLTEFLALEVPMRYLCSENCMGLCHGCGKDLNTGECGCEKQGKNPAFNILDNFFESGE